MVAGEDYDRILSKTGFVERLQEIADQVVD